MSVLTQLKSLNTAVVFTASDLFHKTQVLWNKRKILGNDKFIITIERDYLEGSPEKFEFVYNSYRQASDELAMHIENAQDSDW